MLFTFCSLPTDGKRRTSYLSLVRYQADNCSISIEDAIKCGTTVIVDRYYSSGCVYSAAKNNPSLDLKWARHPEEGLPRPDVCIFLDISAADAARRGGWGEERYEKKEMQDRVRELFAEIKSSPDGDDFVRIDAGKSLGEVENAVEIAFKHAFDRVKAQDAPLRRIKPW
jgi:dTMP kinase